jgi:hypothetical protein
MCGDDSDEWIEGENQDQDFGDTSDVVINETATIAPIEIAVDRLVELL